MPIILPANTITGGYEVANSLRFDEASGDYLSKASFGTPTSTRKSTISFWCKRSLIEEGIIFMNDSATFPIAKIYFDSSHRFSYIEFDPSIYIARTTNAVFRDVSAWYHIVIAIDTTQATADDRVKVYINGVQETSFSTSTTPAQNTDLIINNNLRSAIGGSSTAGTDIFEGYISEIIRVDGQQLDATSFGEFDEDSGIWKPIDVSGLTFGTNGFYLDFENSGSLGADVSGNGNNFTVNNLTSIDQTSDSPTNNFCTMNPLGKSPTGTTGLPTFSNGNLTVAMSLDTFAYSTLGVSQGKWYFEFKQSENTADNAGYPLVGINTTGIGSAGDTVGFRTPSGTNYRGQLGTTSVDNAFLSARVANDIFGFYIDLDNSTLIIHKNGSTYMNTGYESGLDWSGGLTTTNTQTGFYFPYIQSNTSNTFTDSFNFGNPPFTISSGNSDANGYGNFEYSPTLSGVNYYSLCTKNLAEYG
jgi:hypothetical protein